MYKSEWNVMEKLEPMITGEALRERMTVHPIYEKEIKSGSQAVRLMHLSDISSFYLPSDMSVEIYTKLYLAMMKSMQKKESKLAVIQRNVNAKNLRAEVNETGISFDGVLGGSDSFSIIGCSGIGKTTALSKAIQLMGGDKVIEMENPYSKIIPVINVQCPFDCSAKSMLFAILQKIDTAIGSNYYEGTVRSRSNINTLLISTSQVLLNHVAVLCIDEIQNLIKHRAGMQLVSMLTELLNESGISIVFVGTPEIEPFFESVDYLARRTLGLTYGRCAYNHYFKIFCKELWNFQYVSQESKLTDEIINWMYQHSAGTLSHVIFLFQTAQEMSILDGRECVDLNVLEDAYQRMRMLHLHIQPEVRIKKTASKRKKETTLSLDNYQIQEKEKPNEEIKKEGSDMILENLGEIGDEECFFCDMAKIAKKNHRNILNLLQGKISVTEIEV